MTAKAERLTEGEVRDLVSRISYKPGFMFATKYDYGRLMVCVTAMQSQSRAGLAQTRVPVFITQAAPDWLSTRAQLFDFVDTLIQTLDNHEREEWFAVDGLLIRSPHGEPPLTVKVRQPETLATNDRWLVSAEVTAGVQR